MMEIKYFHLQLPVYFLEEIDEYIKKINESRIRPTQYKRSVLFADAVKYYIDNDIAVKKSGK